jgi:putative colanic acid biosynthesis acetyltransferase WcaF
MNARGLRYYSPFDYLRRAFWALVQPLWRWSPRWCWGWRRNLLRVFGAQVGEGVRVYPAARLHQPWNLVIGPRCTIAWNSIIYCLGSVTIGADVVISQGAHLCAGDHAIRDPNFPLLKRPITVADGVWIAADAFIGPSVSIGERAVVGARAVVMRDVPALAVVAGNPARVVSQR